MLLLLVSLPAVAHSLPSLAFAPDRPLFTIKPNPPSAGQDVDVMHLGQRGTEVQYRIGDGPWKDPTIGPDGRFKIPKGELKPGKRLYLADREVPGGRGNLCVLIEP